MNKNLFILLIAIFLSACNEQNIKPAASTSVKPGSVLTGAYKNGVTWKYTGSVKDGMPRGYGVLTASDNSRLEGQWVKWLLVNGSKTTSSGVVEKGDFYNGTTRLFNPVNDLTIISTYADGKFVKKETLLSVSIKKAAFETAFKERGEKAYLGLTFNFNKKTGYFDVQSIEYNSPAYLAGVIKSDQIVAINNITPANNTEFLQLIVNTKYGDGLKLKLVRDNKVITLTAYPSVRPDNYKPQKGAVKLNSYQELIQYYLADLKTFDENVLSLEMPQKYIAMAKGKKEKILKDLYATQKCRLKETGYWLYKASACKNGLAHGKGYAVNFVNDLRFDGVFKNGVRVNGMISLNGVEMYDGPVSSGRPNGVGICFHNNDPEKCEYYKGKRVDAIYKQRMENIKQQRLMDEKLAEMKRMQLEQNSKISKIQNQINASRPTTTNQSQSVGQQLGDYAVRKAGEKVMDELFDRLF
ncbi:MAG: PDZ domain-containing protein [Gammaproteobacteria bacterium]|nr:PDZ domain-containing protein [Gammaproteobacteria bacterium]